jgi:hypothetical protein
MAVKISSPVALFPGTFAEGRQHFRDAASAAGAVLATYANPEKGPNGEDLGTDTAWLGPKDARRLFFAQAGTHGAEGFCGSGIETGWLKSGIFTHLPADTAVLLVHAINPYGFAWVRRVTEDNIDLNRNFVDHAKPTPDNPGYRELRGSICPDEWSPESESRNRAQFMAYAGKHGAWALQAAITQGQYFDDEGVFYGGKAAGWSNRTMREILKPQAGHARKISFIDLHTGLGPYGYGEIICNHLSTDPGTARVKDWFNDATLTDDGTSTSTVVSGDTQIAITDSIPQAEITGITLEYGTLPLEEMLLAVRADNWLHVHGDLRNAKGKEIKSQIRAAFYPDKDDWKKMVWDRAVDVAERAMKGLTQS